MSQEMSQHSAGTRLNDATKSAFATRHENGLEAVKGKGLLRCFAICVLVGCVSNGLYNERDRAMLSRYTPTRYLKTVSHENTTKPELSNKIMPNNKTPSKSVSNNEVPPKNLSYPELIKIRLQRTVKRLPPPRWPDLDHSTAQAIADGILIGKPNSIPMATIVTAYYEFPSKHPTSHYEMAMGRLLEATDPMVIFLEPGSRWVDWFISRRQHALTLIVQRRFQDLVMSTTLQEKFWQHQLDIDPDKNLHNGTGVLKMWNEKMVFIKAVAELNPFNSYSFAWMDAGYFYKHPPDKENIRPLILVNITESGVPRDAMLLHQVCDLAPRAPHEICGAGENFATAGNAFVGTASAVRHLYEKYFETFWAMSKRGLFVGDDQHIMTKTCCNYPQFCHVYYMGLLQRWFVLGHQLFMPINRFPPSTRFAATCENFRIEPVLPLPNGVVWS